jgi:hypothetical protein
MNLIGGLVGGISVAYALVAIRPPDVLTPPDGWPAVRVLVSIFRPRFSGMCSRGRLSLPVSTTHIITSGIAGTMAASGHDVRGGVLARIAITWLVTLPVTIALAGTLFYLLA